VKHRTSPEFWRHYNKLPDDVRRQADRAFSQLKINPSHPSLHFKKVGPYWSARVNLNYRALAIQSGDSCKWFWIGTHARYDQKIP
jgi:hypothetical protein